MPAHRIEITLSDERLAALDEARGNEPRASFIKRGTDLLISQTWVGDPATGTWTRDNTPARPPRDACPSCGHSAAAHSSAREDDYMCELAGCRCPGWLPSERPRRTATQAYLASIGPKPAAARKPRPKGKR